MFLIKVATTSSGSSGLGSASQTPTCVNRLEMHVKNCIQTWWILHSKLRNSWENIVRWRTVTILLDSFPPSGIPKLILIISGIPGWLANLRILNAKNIICNAKPIILNAKTTISSFQKTAHVVQSGLWLRTISDSSVFPMNSTLPNASHFPPSSPVKSTSFEHEICHFRSDLHWIWSNLAYFGLICTEFGLFCRHL